MEPLFELDTVTFSRAGHCVLDSVDMVVPDGGITALTGPSGSGKSTVLRLCNRLLVPDEGTVRFRGSDVAGIDPCTLRRRVGMVFQHPIPFAGSVSENLAVAGEHEPADVAQLLERVGLDAGFASRDARKLSGGEAQRMCLARTLATRPEALLVDEGTSALDEDATAVLEALVMEEARRGRPVLWVTHDLAQAGRIATHRIHMPGPDRPSDPGRDAGPGDPD